MITTGINEQLWQFPCEYHLKVMGHAEHPLTEIVSEIAAKHIHDFDATRITTRSSSNGKYISITAIFTLQNKTQIEQLYLELHTRKEILWTL